MPAVFDYVTDRLKTAIASIGRTTKAVGNRTLSLVSQWLYEAKWLIDTTWTSLVKESYGKNAVVYACIKELCHGVPEARIKAYTGQDDDRKELDRDHELNVLLRHPNELMTEYEMLELCTIHMAVAGKTVWWKERNNLGQPIALWPLRPDRVGPIYAPLDAKPGQKVLSGWSYLDPSSNNYIGIPRVDAFTINFPDPDGESGGLVEGLGPLSVLSREVAADNKATEHVGNLMANHAQPTVAILVKEAGLTEDEQKMVKAKFRADFGGSNLGTPAVLDGESDVKILGFSLKDLEFPGLRDNAEARICSVLGVPAVLAGVHVGLKESNQRANTKELREYFTETTLSAYWRRYADQFTLELAADFGEDIYCEFDTSNVRALAGQRLEAIEPIKEAFVQGAAMLAEYRAALGLPPIVPPEEGEVFYVPSTVTVTPASDKARAIHDQRAQENLERQQQMIAAQGGESDDGQGEEAGEQEGEQRREEIGQRKAIALLEYIASASVTDTEAKQIAVEAVAEARQHLRTIKAVDPRDEAERRLQLALEGLFAKLLPDIAARIRKGEMIPDDELAAAFSKIIEPQLVEAATAEGIRIAAEMTIGFDTAAFSQEMSAWAKQYTYDLVKGLTDTTRKVLQDVMGKYQSTPGMTRGELEKLLQPAFGAERAEMIAITENTRAHSEAMSEYQRVLEGEGIRMEATWHTLADELVCSICGPLNQKREREWKDRFPGGPPAHVRCLPGDAYVTSSSRIAAGTKRWYEGDMLFICTASGDELAVTPNHPILTLNGWLPAKVIQPGFYIMRCVDANRMTALIDPNHKNVPASIEQIVSTLVGSYGVVSASVPITPKDFHGDGSYGYVDLVRPARQLRYDRQAQLAKHIAETNLIRTTDWPLSSQYSSRELFLSRLSSFSSYVCSSNLVSPLLGRHERPLQSFSGRLVANVYTSSNQVAADDATADTEMLCNGIFRQAGFIEPTNVVSVQAKSFRGHVYNLETELGWYISDNIITHNCRCSKTLSAVLE